MNFDPNCAIHKKQTQSIIDLKKKKREIRKHLEGNIRENLCDFWLSNDFLHTKSKQYIKEQIDKLDCIKMKKLCSKQHH